MKAVVKILMYVAAGIMLMHNIVPHRHHGEASEEEHCLQNSEHQNDSLLDLLSDFFHADLGDDHLEDIRQAGANQLSFLSPALLDEAQSFLFRTLIIEPNTSDYRRPQDLALPDYLVVSLRSLRSPPSSIHA